MLKMQIFQNEWKEPTRPRPSFGYCSTSNNLSAGLFWFKVGSFLKRYRKTQELYKNKKLCYKINLIHWINTSEFKLAINCMHLDVGVRYLKGVALLHLGFLGMDATPADIELGGYRPFLDFAAQTVARYKKRMAEKHFGKRKSWC